MSIDVSVVIPAYNTAHCVGDAVRSAARQIGVTTEIIVVDDASTDAMPEILAALQRKFPRLRVIRHEKNKGVSAARNTGINAATAPYIAFLDSDDEWMRDKLRVQLSSPGLKDAPRENVISLSYFENNHANGQPSYNASFLQGGGDVATGYVPKSRHAVFRKVGGPLFEASLASFSFWLLPGSTLVAHRDVFAHTGLFEEKLGCFEDSEFVLRHMLRGGAVDILPVPLARYFVPAPNKTYATQTQFLSFLTEKYLCQIAQRWGDAAAFCFHENLSRTYARLNRVPAVSAGYREARGAFLNVTPNAPCRTGDMDCALSGLVCRLAPLAVAAS